MFLPPETRWPVSRSTPRPSSAPPRSPRMPLAPSPICAARRNIANICRLCWRGARWRKPSNGPRLAEPGPWSLQSDFGEMTSMANQVRVTAKINGQETSFLCEPRQSALEVLRETLNLTGSKEGCNNGNCGACNIILNGVLVTSCLVLGVELEGAEVTTIEGIAPADGLHPLQK